MVLACLLVVSVPVLADSEEEIDMPDFDLQTNGMTLGFMNVDVEDLNKAIDGEYPELDSSVILFGGANQFGFKNGIRFGGFGVGGVTTNEDENGAMSQLAVGFGGLDVEYGKALSDQVDASAGLVAGVGSTELTLRKNELTDVSQPNKIYLANVFFTAGPKATVNFNPTENVTLQGYGTYLFSLGGNKWKDGKDTTDVLDPVKVEGPAFGFSISFNY